MYYNAFTWKAYLKTLALEEHGCSAYRYRLSLTDLDRIVTIAQASP
jgi:hypothetical protein